MAQETRFLEALGGAIKYSFLPGKLALTTRVESVYKTLLFVPRREDVEPEANGRRPIIEDAKRRGVDFYAAGNEPSWTLEIGSEEIVFQTNYGQDTYRFPTSEPEVDVGQVREWARQAGRIALRYFNRVEGTRKEDRTLVTDADLEIEDLLVDCLKRTYPDHGIVGEEGTNEVCGDYVWAIDPLDGTRAFLSGLPVWGVPIGLLWRGQPWLGVFHLPLLDEWYYSPSPSEGAFWNDQPIHCPVPQGWNEDSLLCVPADVHLEYGISFPGIVRALGSAAAHLCYVARGNAMAVFLHKPGIWDIAAGAAILEAAGGSLRYLDGAEVVSRGLLDAGTTLEPLLAAHPSIIDQLRAHIERRRS